ncbi:hypothetical protein DENSPDRAFT_886524, partial [Dentipellis sp. KUC8613]
MPPSAALYDPLRPLSAPLRAVHAVGAVHAVDTPCTPSARRRRPLPPSAALSTPLRILSAPLRILSAPLRAVRAVDVPSAPSLHPCALSDASARPLCCHTPPSLPPYAPCAPYTPSTRRRLAVCPVAALRAPSPPSLVHSHPRRLLAPQRVPSPPLFVHSRPPPPPCAPARPLSPQRAPPPAPLAHSRPPPSTLDHCRLFALSLVDRRPHSFVDRRPHSLVAALARILEPQPP